MSAFMIVVVIRLWAQPLRNFDIHIDSFLNLILNVAHGVKELTLGQIELLRLATWWDVFFNALAAN